MNTRQWTVIMAVFTALMSTVSGAFAVIPGDPTLSLQVEQNGKVVTTVEVDSFFHVLINIDYADGVSGAALTLTYDNAKYMVVDAGGIEVDGEFTPPQSMFGIAVGTTTEVFVGNSVLGESKVMLSGANIDTSGQGSDGDGAFTGPQTLFTVRFQAVAEGAAAADFALEESRLCNPAAGWGTDSNDDGVCEDNPLPAAPILVGSLAEDVAPDGSPGVGQNPDDFVDGFGGDISDDFYVFFQTDAGDLGAPLGVHNIPQGGNPAEAPKLLSWDGIVVADFGAGRGLWVHDGAVWQKLTSLDPQNMIIWNGNLVIDFGVGQGISLHNGTGFQRVTSMSGLKAWLVWFDGSEEWLVMDFGHQGTGGQGFWRYNGSELQKLTGWGDVDEMVVYDNKLAVDFGDNGLWRHDSSAWKSATGWGHVDSMVGWGAVLAVDFGEGRGVFTWAGDATWQKLTSLTALTPLLVRDTRLVLEFPSGIWEHSGAGWTRLATWGAVSKYVWEGDKLVVDFGESLSRGLWRYDDTGWKKLTGWADLTWMTGCTDGLAVNFGNGRGLWIFDGDVFTKATIIGDIPYYLPHQDRMVLDFGVDAPGQYLWTYNQVGGFTKLVNWSVVE